MFVGVRRRSLDLALVVSLEHLSHGHLLAVSLLVEELGFATVQGLRHAARLVRLSGLALSSALFMIQTLPVSSDVLLDVSACVS